MVGAYTQTGMGTYKERVVYTMILTMRDRHTRVFHVYTQQQQASERARARLWSLACLLVRLEEIRREVEKKRVGQAMHT